MALIIRCDRCNCELTHICEPKLKEAAKDLLKWAPEAVQEAVGADVEGVPFLSEVCLYPLLGKEDARTLLALVHWLIKQTGLDVDALRLEAHREREAEQQEAVAREAARERRAAARKTRG